MGFKRFLRIFSAACVLGLLAAAIPFTPVLALTGIISYANSVTSGAPGTIVLLNATNFTAGQTATLYFDATPISSISTGTGTFSISGVIPAATPGQHALSVTTPAPDTSNSLLFVVGAPFTLSATTGFVGDQVQVTGTGFPASQPVTFIWDGASTVATITANSSGAITGTITIPPSTRGAHTISTSISTPQTFTVNSKIVINPTSGIVGDTVSVVGSGFAAAPSNVFLTLDGVNITATTPSQINTVGTTGGFSCTFVMPPVARGPHTIRATDTGFAEATFTIGQRISITPVSGYAGDNVIVSGSGFAASRTITFRLDGTVLTVSPAVVTSDHTGAFSNVSFIIPSVGGGAHLIRATDQDGNFHEVTLTVLTRLSITPTTGTAGTQITVTGSGFAANAPVAITWDNAALSPAVNTTASATGTISVTFTAPASARGQHAVKAADTSGNSATTNFDITAKIVLSPASGAWDDTVTITFSGFTAGSTLTASMLSGSTAYSVVTTPTTVTADASGNATASFKVAAVFNGSWTIQASGTNASATATLTVTQKIMLGATTGVAGDTVTLTGTGFVANKSITLKYNNVAIATNPSAVTSDANGSFVCQFTVPSTVAGTMPVAATDGTVTATLNFTATAKATISKSTTQSDPGNVGMEISVSGTGFKASADITVSFESTPVTVATVKSDAGGSFTATFKVPVATAGSHTIKATDGTTTKEFAFFMDSTAPSAPALTVPIDKFKPKQPVAFTWNAVTDPSGVTYTFQIAHDAAFATLTIPEKSGLTATTYTMTAAEKLKSSGANTPYYWRVRATDQAGNVSAWSKANTFTIGFIWPPWIIHVWYGLGIVAALVLGLWFGRRMAYQSY